MYLHDSVVWFLTRNTQGKACVFAVVRNKDGRASLQEHESECFQSYCHVVRRRHDSALLLQGVGIAFGGMCLYFSENTTLAVEVTQSWSPCFVFEKPNLIPKHCMQWLPSTPK